MAKYNIDFTIAPVTAFCALWLLQRGSTVSFLRDQPTNIYLAGYPVATVPLGQLDFNGQPFSLSTVTTAHNEGKLLHFMSAWEATFPKRAVPNLSDELGTAHREFTQSA
jgi:Asp-tRNA(Asn)/Glu-tRNA(Gln) amidotransferase A subunit family amidase